jgi:hypothetical protein
MLYACVVGKEVYVHTRACLNVQRPAHVSTRNEAAFVSTRHAAACVCTRHAAARVCTRHAAACVCTPHAAACVCTRHAAACVGTRHALTQLPETTHLPKCLFYFCAVPVDSRAVEQTLPYLPRGVHGRHENQRRKPAKPAISETHIRTLAPAYTRAHTHARARTQTHALEAYTDLYLHSSDPTQPPACSLSLSLSFPLSLSLARSLALSPPPLSFFLSLSLSLSL